MGAYWATIARALYVRSAGTSLWCILNGTELTAVPEFNEMDATMLVREALRVISDAGVPEKHVGAALPAVIELLARGQAPAAPDMALVPYQALQSAPPGGALSVDRLATRLGVPRDLGDGIYTGDGTELQISVHPGRLPRAKSSGTKALALLVTALRQAGDEEFTPVDEIRKVAQEYDRYDPANFASAIAEMRGAFLVKGAARHRSLKLTRPGWQQAADLIRMLGASDS